MRGDRRGVGGHIRRSTSDGTRSRTGRGRVRSGVGDTGLVPDDLSCDRCRCADDRHPWSDAPRSRRARRSPRWRGAVGDGGRDHRVATRGPSGRNVAHPRRRIERLPPGVDAPSISADRARRPRGGRWTGPPTTRQPIRAIPRAARSLGHARGTVPPAPRTSRRPRGVARIAPARGCRSADSGPPRTGGGAGSRDPHRTPGSSRPGRRRQLHDGRCQPRRRDLRMEHRHRRRGDRGVCRPHRSAASRGRDDGRDRGLHRVRGCVAIGAPRRRDGRRGVAGPREWPGRSSGGCARLGRDAPAPRRSAARRRRRVPAVRPGDRRAHRVGDAR